MTFQPGQSGNPGGRTVKEKIYRETLRKAIHEIAESDPQKRKKLELVVEKHVQNCLDGDQAAINALADRIDGKVPQAHIGSDDPDDPPIAVGLVELRPVKPDSFTPSELNDEQRAAAARLVMPEGGQ